MLILFDLFETLLDGEYFDFDKALHFLHDEYFSSVDEEEFFRLSQEFFDTYLRNRDEREYSFWRQLFFYQEHTCTLVLDEQEAELRAFQVCRKENLAKGAKELLCYLKQRGYTVAVLSNNIFSAKTLTWYLEQFGIAQYIDRVYSSADILWRKPHIEAFEIVLNDLQEKPSSDILFVGNSLEKDIKGAESAGLTPVLIRKQNEAYDGLSFADLLEFKTYLEENFLYVQSFLPRESLVDGPGLRTVVFLQGCDKGCHGCHNPVTLPMGGGTRYSVEELSAILKEQAQNKKITISGGEPLLQERALKNLLNCLEGYDLCLYTGREFKEVPHEILEKIHYLKTGEYREEQRTTIKPYMGSDNQTFIDLRRDA